MGAICEEGDHKPKQANLPSSAIRSATETTSLSGKITVEIHGVGSCGATDTLVPKMVPFDKKKLLVLDINGVLADINTDYSYTKYADMKISGKLGKNLILYYC